MSGATTKTSTNNNTGDHAIEQAGGSWRYCRFVTEDAPIRPPSVDALARSLRSDVLPDPLLVEVARKAIAAGSWDDSATLVRERERRLLQPVVNATGVLLHTNLGRAPFPIDHQGGASNLEFDLATGKRGSRHEHA